MSVKVSARQKRIYKRVSFKCNESWSPLHILTSVLKGMGFTVYDLTQDNSTLFGIVDLVITNKPIKRHKGKEL